MIMPLQSLRAIAALLVISVHGSNNIVYREFGYENEVYSWFKIWGDIGVDIFFVLSGFVMTMTAIRHNSLKKFFIGRVFRIYPLYILSLLVYLVIFIVGKNQLDLLDLVKSIFLIFQEKETHYYTLLGPAWTLGFEFLFYLCCAVYILFSDKTIFGYFSRLIFPFILLFIFSYLHTLMIEFLFGVLIYYVYSKSRKYLLLLVFVFGSASLYSLLSFDYSTHFASNQYRFYYFGLIASLLLCMFLVFGLTNRFFEYLGEVSYSLYLTHMALSIHVFGKVWEIFGYINYFQAFAVYILFSVVVAAIFYHVFEKPMYLFFKQRFLK